MIEAVQSKSTFYTVPAELPSSYGQNDYTIKTVPNKTYSFEPDLFLKKDRPLTRFINTSEEVKELVEKTFMAVTNKKLDNVIIRVCTEEEMKSHHNNWRPGIIGFSLNNQRFPGQVFVLNNFLDRLLITIGHEIGHVFTSSLESKLNEEAKAFAFEFAWINAIRENNIGNLASSLKRALPAVNGLHNVAFDFVLHFLANGKEAMELHRDLVEGHVSMENILQF